ncbi:MAG: cell division protein ZapA [Lachnospiraceae bacterium]|nr:cell division protein ZapA [Lachnospiraceae bacterium]MCR5477973.1 cell division protein ZapA [Lachnospiraceae bacterium]
MADKTETQVVIGGKMLTISGYESADMTQRIASYINDMIDEYEKLDAYRLQPADIRSILLQINIADDFFKAKKRIDQLEEELAEKDKTIYDLKHDLVNTQMKLDTAQKQVTQLQEKASESMREIGSLEAQLKKKKA